MSIRSNIVPEWTVDPLADFDPHEDCDDSPCDECIALAEVTPDPCDSCGEQDPDGVYERAMVDGESIRVCFACACGLNIV